MIHSLSGGVITQYDKLIYAFAEIKSGAEAGVKRWYISPFRAIKAGVKAIVPSQYGGEATAEIIRVEVVTAQTAPFPVKRTGEIIRLLP